MAELDLEVIRKEIDKVDRQLAAILEARLGFVMQVAEYKKAKGMPVKDKAREAKVVEKVTGFLDNKDYVPAVETIMHSIMDAACVLEEAELAKNANRNLKIGCFGVPGSFTHQALEDYFEGRIYERQHYNLFEEVITAVSKGEVDYGVVPIENSSTGGITEVYDLLRKFDCSIVGERCLKIEQNLLGYGEATLNDIKKVYSHPQGLAQSKEFFKDHPQMEKIPYYSTSKSAETVAEQKDITLAAVAGKKAAELYGLKILAENINFNSNNSTRFVIITKASEKVAGANKITVVFAVKHEAGSLYKTLGHLHHRGLNMLNIESRPMEGKSWEYFFHVDLMGNLEDPDVIEGFEAVQNNCTYFKILGNYRADDRKE